MAEPGADAAIDKASFLVGQHRPKEAIDFARQAGMQSPEDPRPYAIMGLALAQLNDPAAADWALLAISKEPNGGQWHRIAGSIIHERGNALAAEPHLRKAIELDPHDDYAHNNLAAILLESRKRLPEARQHLETALQINPESQDAYHNLSIVLEGLGDHKGSQAALATALRLKPDDAQTQWLLGHTRIKGGDLGSAEAALRASLRLDPKSERTKDHLAMVQASRHPVLGVFGKYLLFMSRMSTRARWIWVIAFIIVAQALKATSRSINPALGIGVAATVFIFVVFTWTARPLLRLFVRKGWIDG